MAGRPAAELPAHAFVSLGMRRLAAGEYAECNPIKEAPHPFNCTHHMATRSCWNKDKEHPTWAKDFAGVCDPKQCTCNTIEHKAVGREFPNFGARAPPGTPPACALNFYPLEHFRNKNESSRTIAIADTSLAACCAACTASNDAGSECGSYTFTPELFKKPNGTCQLHGATNFLDLAPALLARPKHALLLRPDSTSCPASQHLSQGLPGKSGALEPPPPAPRLEVL